ncbi:MAG: hypothetical protein HPM95_18095 [Alphaproteobacteria bacterium]|nr:hypothetical protein [Alphaproteobacteria bacterium]
MPGMILTGVGTATSPWLMVLGALVIWRDLYTSMKIELDYRHASAMLAMWDNHDGRKWISEDRARAVTNARLESFGFPVLDEGAFADVITELAKAGCIRIERGRIRLKEWIRRSIG